MDSADRRDALATVVTVVVAELEEDDLRRGRGRGCDRRKRGQHHRDHLAAANFVFLAYSYPDLHEVQAELAVSKSSLRDFTGLSSELYWNFLG